VNVANQRHIEQRFRLNPEVVAAFALSLCVCYERRHQLQNVFFASDIRKRVVVHGLFETDDIENPHVISGSSKHLSALRNQRPLGVSNHKRTPLRLGTLHDVRLDEKACFAAAGTADDKHVLIPRVFGIRRAAAHGQTLRLGQDDVVPRVSVHERRNVAWLSPAGSAVFFAVPILLGIPAFCMYQQAQCASAQKPNQQVKGHKAGQSVSERHCHAIPQVQEFRGKIRPG